MNRLKLGIVLETTGLPVRRGLHAASELALHGVRIDAIGDLDPGRLTGTGRREFGNERASEQKLQLPLDRAVAADVAD